MNGKDKKVITLPISGSMYIGHSKKLEWAIRDFITMCDGSYYDDEIDKGIIKSYFRLKNDICVEQKVQIRKEDYICYTTLSCHIDPNDKENVSKFVQMANSINLELDYGNFEIDFRTGDIRYKTVYEPDEKVYMEALDKLLGYPKRMIDKFGHCFLILGGEPEEKFV